MPRLKWPADLTPRLFYADDQLESRRDELRRYVAREAVPIAPVRVSAEDAPGFGAADLDDSSWPVVEAGAQLFTRADQLIWLRATVAVPERLAGKPLAIRFGAGDPRRGGRDIPESLLFLDGEPYSGIDSNHDLVFLPEALGRGGAFSLAVQAWSARGAFDRFRWRAPELIWFDAEVDALAWDFDAIYRTISALEPNHPGRVALLRLAEDATRALDWTEPRSERFYASVAACRRLVADRLDALKGQEGLKPTVWHVGHTHLDVAWLWTLANIKLKTARSWASALRTAEHYPEFTWIQSQPQLYKFVKHTQPALWEQVKRRVAEGRWEADGGMWVEADCNVSGGEALVRQFVHGIRFFRDELGARNVVLWLPDVFGYSWALPQIIRKCGLRYFMTTKISWSQFNRFPYDTFLWRGLDGTEVLTHFVGTPSPGQAGDNWITTYNGMILPETVKGNWDRYQQKELGGPILCSFGYGDGGGGPTRENMEMARRLQDMPGIPHVRIGRVDEFFRQLQEQVGDDPHLPRWNGELYLEYHRGTLTSQAQNKRANRKSEFLLHNAELYAAAATALAGASYPHDDLFEAWEIVLRNQFHDIIPGSSIHEVYEDSAREYEQAFALGAAVLHDAAASLTRSMDLPVDSLIVFNPTGVERSDLVEADLPDGLAPAAEDGTPLPRQGAHVFVPAVPPNGWKAFPLRSIQPLPEGEAAGTAGEGRGTPADTLTPTFSDGERAIVIQERRIKTPFYLIELNERGQITRIYDRLHERDVLAPGAAGNVLQAFEDKPLRFDAWDIDIYYQQKATEVADLVESAVEEHGQERGVLRLVWHYHGSTITQRLIVYSRDRRIDFDTAVDWQLSQVLLKVAFPVDVHCTRATFDIQFGNVERPTHWNTSWDWARFETCGHKWADLSEGGYGVALLNDCKYGYDVKDNVLRLTLIKSGIHPDPTADRGRHAFVYSLLPHAGDWLAGGVAEHGYRLNNPLIAHREPAHAGALPAACSLVSCDAPHVMVETVKAAFDGDGLVVRAYEFGNARGPVTLTFPRPIASAEETNLLEEDPQPVEVDGACLRFRITPYAIRTFRVRLRK